MSPLGAAGQTVSVGNLWLVGRGSEVDHLHLFALRTDRSFISLLVRERVASLFFGLLLLVMFVELSCTQNHREEVLIVGVDSGLEQYVNS